MSISRTLLGTDDMAHSAIRLFILLLFIGSFSGIVKFGWGNSTVIAKAAFGEGSWDSVGPWGGAVYNMTVSLHDSQVMFARSSGGISRSLDGGTTWDLVEDRFDSKGRNPIVFSPFDTNHLVAPEEYEDAFLESVDGGETWVRRSVPFDPRTLLFHPLMPDTLFAVTEEESYRSDNGGETWTRLSFPNGYSPISLLIHPLTGELFGCGTGGLYVSPDNGATWVLRNGTTYGYKLEILHPESNTLIALQSGLVQKSTDGGSSWTLLYNGLPDATSTSDIVMDPHDHLRLYIIADNANLYRTTEDGQQWELIETELPIPYLEALAISSTTPTSLFLVGNGIYKSTDEGLTWLPSYSGISSLYLNAIAIYPTDSSHILVADGDTLYQSTDSGLTWESNVISGTHAIASITITPGTSTSTIYLGTHGKGVWQSVDNGTTWEQISEGLPTEPTDTIYDVAVDPGNSDKLIAVLGSSSIYYSENGGDLWVSAQDNTFKRIRFALFDPNDGLLVWAGTAGGLLKSIDGGANWEIVATQGIPSDADIRAIVIDPLTSTLYLSILEDNNLYRSTDGGGTWLPVATNFPSGTTIPAIWLDKVTPTTLLIAGNELDQYDRITNSYGIYRSTDGGSVWSSFDIGLTYPAITRIVGNGTFLYGMTDRVGVYQFEIPLVPSPTATPTTILQTLYLPVIQN
jgi:photosystem II stability/assembly factor-like uncharacterized protein